jgi:hypothetical protein
VTSRPGDGSPVEVRLLGMPVAAYQRACQHDDELLRELTLAHSGQPAVRCAPPAGLRELIEELEDRFELYSDAPQAHVEAAVARGDSTVDITVAVSPDARARALGVASSLAAADEYCHRGDLLTLAAPPPVVELREWYLRQIVDQLDGRAPTPWADR